MLNVMDLCPVPKGMMGIISLQNIWSSSCSKSTNELSIVGFDGGKYLFILVLVAHSCFSWVAHCLTSLLNRQIFIIYGSHYHPFLPSPMQIINPLVIGRRILNWYLDDTDENGSGKPFVSYPSIFVSYLITNKIQLKFYFQSIIGLIPLQYKFVSFLLSAFTSSNQ